jgi:hypothetical protein
VGGWCVEWMGGVGNGRVQVEVFSVHISKVAER